MLLLELLGVLITLLFFTFLITQVVMPLIFTTPFFPLFRKSTLLSEEVKTTEKKLEETVEQYRLARRLEDVNRELDEISATTKPYKF